MRFSGKEKDLNKNILEPGTILRDVPHGLDRGIPTDLRAGRIYAVGGRGKRHERARERIDDLG